MPDNHSPSKPRTKPKIAALPGKLRGALAKPGRSKKRVCLVLNPAAGQQNPDLKVMNKIFGQAGYQWDIQITTRMGDGQRLARRAVLKHYDIVAAYGGDGTVMDVASGLLNTDVPLAILPGGTGNALAADLGIPRLIGDACALLADPAHNIRTIDAMRSGTRIFLLRVGVGLEALIVRTADRSLKDRFGVWAYLMGMVQALGESHPSRYKLEMDSQTVETEGLACMIANAGTIGIPGISLSPRVSIHDGLLDIFVIRNSDLAAVFTAAASLAGAEHPPTPDILHYQTPRITVHADPPQGVEGDGELIGHSPVSVEVLPGALKVITPGEL